MAKLERTVNGSAPTLADNPASEIASNLTVKVDSENLVFELAKGKGTAEFRQPTPADLQAAEQKGVNLANQSHLAKLCRLVAEATCVRWGEFSEMPPAEKIRRQDSDQKTLLFMQVLAGVFESSDVSAYSRVLSSESSRGDGFDAYEVTLSDGTVLVFDEPTEMDVVQREKAKTHTDGMIRLASALCRQWGGQPIKWSDGLNHFKSLSLEDFVRVSNTLNNFSG